MFPFRGPHDGPSNWRYKPMLAIAQAQKRAGLTSEASATIREAAAIARQGTEDERLYGLTYAFYAILEMGQEKGDFDLPLAQAIGGELMVLARDSKSGNAKEALDILERRPALWNPKP